MTLSLQAKNAHVSPVSHVIAFHADYENPESEVTLGVNGQQAVLDPQQAKTLGHFLLGGHKAVFEFEGAAK